MKVILIFLFFVTFQSFSQQAFKEGQWYGFKQDEDVIIVPDYEYAADFSEGYGAVKKYDKWGFVDKNNKWLVEPIYDKVAPFQNGYAKVVKEGKYGLISTSGELVLKTVYDEISFQWNYVKLKKGNKVGLYVEQMPMLPCKYTRVGLNDNGLAYGKIAKNNYEIYNGSGLVLTNQEHSFSSWDVKNGEAIAKTENGYGIHNVHGRTWIIDPEYEHIERLRTESYSEFDKNGDPVEYDFIYAIFENVDGSEQQWHEKVIGENSIELVTTEWNEVIAKDVKGYERVEEGSGYNKTYDYIIHFKNGEAEMLNTILGINHSFDVEDKYEHFGALITKENGMTSLYYGDELYIAAEDIKPLTQLEKEMDAAGNERTVETLVELPYVIVRQSQKIGLYDVYHRKFVVDNLPDGTQFEVKQNTNNIDFEIVYSDGQLMGMVTKKLNATEMIYSKIEQVTKTPYLILGFDNKENLVRKTNLQEVIVTGDKIELLELYRGYAFIISENNKKSIYNPRSEKTTGSYDEIDRSNEFQDAVITRVNGLYGLHDVKGDQFINPRAEDKGKLVEKSTYPYYFIKEGDQWIGIDGYTYSGCLNYTDLFLDESGVMGIGAYDCESGEEVEFVSDARFSTESYYEIYPFFHVKGENKKWGIVNHLGDTLVPFEYLRFDYADVDGDWSDYPDDEILMPVTKNGVGLLTPKMGELLPAEYDHIEIDYDFLDYDTQAARLFKKKKEGYFLNGKGVVYPAIYKSIDHAYDFLDWDTDTLVLTDKKGKMGLGSINGDVFLPIVYDEISSYYADYAYDLIYYYYPILELKLGKKKGLYVPTQNKMLIEPKFDEIRDIEFVYQEEYDTEAELYAFITISKKKKGVFDYHGNELLPALFDEIFTYPNNSYGASGAMVVWGELEGKLYANLNNPLEDGMAVEFSLEKYYDRVLGYCGYRLSEGKIEKHNFLTGEEELFEDEVTMDGVEFDLLYKDGMYGAIDKDGNILVEPIYETADFMPHRESEVMIGYQNGIKYYVYVFNNERYTEEEW